MKTRKSQHILLKKLFTDFNKTISCPKFNWDPVIELLQTANNAYYNGSSPIMSDVLYDKLKDAFEEKFPKHPLLTNVGAPITKSKVKLPFWMGSMNKIKPGTKSLITWFSKHKSPYLISDKLDGVSCIYYKEQSKPARLYTRGNGEYGQDISHLLSYIKTFNTADKNHTFNDKTFCCRGEIILSKDKFTDKYAAKNSNARNLVSGLVNAKNIQKRKSLAKDVDIVMYEIIEPTNLTPEEQLKTLKELNFNVVSHNVHPNELNEDTLKEILLKCKAASKYEIDGIIIAKNISYVRNTIGNPKYSIAFKMVLDEQTAVSKVINVIWTPSKDGFLKPRIEIEPVVLSGVNIRFTTGFNAKFIKDSGIGPGAVIEIIRSGDVIPYVKQIITTVSPSFPEEDYVWNNTEVDIVLKNPEDNKIVLVKNITRFFKKLEIKGLNNGNITRIVNHGYSSIEKIINASISDFQKIDGFKIKMATNIYNNIHNIISKPIELVCLMNASGCFGRGIGLKKIKPVLEQYPNILDELTPTPTHLTIEDLCLIEGYSTKTAQVFMGGLYEFKEFLDRNPNRFQTTNKTASQQTESEYFHKLFNGKRIVITGFRDKELEKRIEENGGKITASVNSKTSFVIRKNKKSNSTKIKRAVELNKAIYTLDEINNQ